MPLRFERCAATSYRAPRDGEQENTDRKLTY
jgi:hypothetical protein